MILIVGLTSMARAAYGQTPATSLAELRSRVSIGETVFVTNDAGDVIEGRVQGISDTVLLVQSEGGDRTFASQDVRRVARRGHAVRTTALAGALAGFAVGALWAAQQPCDFTCFSSASGVFVFGAVGGGAGLAAGAVVGAAVSREQVLFERTATNGPAAAVTLRLPVTARAVLVQIDWR